MNQHHHSRRVAWHERRGWREGERGWHEEPTGVEKRMEGQAAEGVPKLLLCAHAQHAACTAACVRGAVYAKCHAAKLPCAVACARAMRMLPCAFYA